MPDPIDLQAFRAEVRQFVQRELPAVVREKTRLGLALMCRLALLAKASQTGTTMQIIAMRTVLDLILGLTPCLRRTGCS